MIIRIPFVCVLLVSAVGCVSQNETWSFLHTQKPTSQQASALLTTAEKRLRSELGFSDGRASGHGSSYLIRSFDGVGVVEIQLMTGDYPLIQIRAHTGAATSPAVQRVFQLIEEVYVQVGLPAPHGPARSTVFPLQ